MVHQKLTVLTVFAKSLSVQLRHWRLFRQRLKADEQAAANMRARAAGDRSCQSDRYRRRVPA